MPHGEADFNQMDFPGGARLLPRRNARTPNPLKTIHRFRNRAGSATKHTENPSTRLVTVGMLPQCGRGTA